MRGGLLMSTRERTVRLLAIVLGLGVLALAPILVIFDGPPRLPLIGADRVRVSKTPKVAWLTIWSPTAGSVLGQWHNVRDVEAWELPEGRTETVFVTDRGALIVTTDSVKTSSYRLRIPTGGDER
jgi:hypothetical protein